MGVSRFRKMGLSLVGVALLASLGLTGCSNNPGGGSSTGADDGAKADDSAITVFSGQVGNYTAPNFNPFNNTGAFLQPTQGAIYESLFYFNKAQVSDPVPLLGQSYSWNDDGTVLTIKIREGVKFSDGTAMTADDVAFSLNLYASEPSMNGGTQRYDVKKVDDTTVELDFYEVGFTMEAAIVSTQAIVPKALWEDIDDPTSGTNENPVGTGPYMLADNGYTPQAITLQRNPNYWGTGDEAPTIEWVRYVTLANADAATTALQQGEVDWMGSFLPTLDDIVADSNGAITYSNTPLNTTSLFACMNPDLGCSGPQTDPAVRQAMYYAMDRTQLNEQAGAGFGTPASPTLLLNTVNEPQITNQDWLETPQTADPAKAKSLLEAAGWALGDDGIYAKDGQRLSMTVIDVSGWTDYNTIAQLLVGQFAEAGIELIVSDIAQNAWTQAEVSGSYQLSLNSVNMQASSDPYFLYNYYLSSGATAKVGESTQSNNTRYSNTEVDDAIATLATTNDDAVKAEQYGIIQQHLIDEMPMIPIYVNSALCEYNNSHATGWPEEGNLYVFPLPWGGNWGTGILLRTVRPV
ncbi:MAG: ABC transporter substrate-binding protein [Propionibacteriaceae bacterium]|nr:ABC transporter substrate-binding protein [Propionibacteriaceae bacterium]